MLLLVVDLQLFLIQFSKITTLKKNSKELEFLRENIEELCVQVNRIAIENNKMYRSIGIQFVNEDLSTKTKSRMLRNPGNNIMELKKSCKSTTRRSIGGSRNVN